MTYGEARDKVLMLLNQYSAAGEKVPSTYNNQQDVLNRVPGLLNDGINEVSTGSYGIWIPALVQLDRGAAAEADGLLLFPLPGDFFAFQGGGLARLERGEVVKTPKVTLLGRDTLAVSAEEKGPLWLAYFRRPVLLDEYAPAESDELDNVREAQEAAVYYAAANQFMLDDNSFAYAACYNKYEDKLAKGRAPVYGQWGSVEDGYGCVFGGDWG